MDNSEKISFGQVTSAQDIGRLIFQQRKAQGLTQTDLAGLGRITSRVVSDIERGKGTVQLQKVLHVLSLLGLDVHIVDRKGRDLRGVRRVS
jgi:y4mF family transcriptional regulator